MRFVAIVALVALVDSLPPRDAEREARLAAVRSLSAIYFKNAGPPKTIRVLCLAIDESSATGDPLPDDKLPTEDMLQGRDDDPDAFYLKKLSGLRPKVVPFSQCPKGRWQRDGPADGPVRVRLRAVRWVGVDTIELPTVTTRPADPCTYTKAFRYVWADNSWQERPFDFGGEQCPY
jgi:hypothetical protein